MFKNPTPRQIAFYVAIAITVLVLFFNLLINGLMPQLAPAMSVSIAPLLVFAVSFLLTNYLIEHFIYRRIKVIYKRISEFRRTGDVAEITPDLEEVEAQVNRWAADKDQKIASLEELEEYRRNYLGNVSHELKTPLFSLQGFLHTLLDGGIHDTEVAVSFLQKAAKNAERLQTIVEDLESISHVESGKLQMDFTVFDIQKLTEEVFDELEIKAKERGIKLQFKEGARNGWLVKADREMVRQILTNLVANSIKYGKQNGITKLSFYDMDKIVLIEVNDNGIGIPRHHHKHVFDRFYRVDSGRSRAAGGSGLGLAIVKHLVEAHEQSIHLRSTENVGSTFGFTLEKA
jgi:two-component system phosphate regulon sensor histidine kinase PhoR